VPDDRSVAVLGVGMHPWGKWGRNFVEYGLAAARDALRARIAVHLADQLRRLHGGLQEGGEFSAAAEAAGRRRNMCSIRSVTT